MPGSPSMCQASLISWHWTSLTPTLPLGSSFKHETTNCLHLHHSLHSCCYDHCDSLVNKEAALPARSDKAGCLLSVVRCTRAGGPCWWCHGGVSGQWVSPIWQPSMPSTGSSYRQASPFQARALAALPLSQGLSFISHQTKG